MRSVRRRLSLDYPFDMFRSTVESRKPLAGFLIDVPAKFSCNHDLIAERSHTFAENAFYFERAVRLRRVENVTP